MTAVSSSIVAEPEADPRRGGSLVTFFLLALACSSVRLVDAGVSGRAAAEILLCLLMASVTLGLFGLRRRALCCGRGAALLLVAILLEAASLLFEVEELIDCPRRLTWCGPPDHFTSSVLLSLLSHAMAFVCLTAGGWRGNPWTGAAAVVAWLASLLVVLNAYNGDLSGLHENYEYTLPHFLVVAVAAATDDDDLVLWTTASVAIVTNLYWVGGSPFNQGSTDLRHRTEFYDTQCYICGGYYVLLSQRVSRWQAAPSP